MAGIVAFSGAGVNRRKMLWSYLRVLSGALPQPLNHIVREHRPLIAVCVICIQVNLVKRAPPCETIAAAGAYASLAV
jgi:hypothetical protein